MARVQPQPIRSLWILWPRKRNRICASTNNLFPGMLESLEVGTVGEHCHSCMPFPVSEVCGNLVNGIVNLSQYPKRLFQQAFQ